MKIEVTLNLEDVNKIIVDYFARYQTFSNVQPEDVDIQYQQYEWRSIRDEDFRVLITLEEVKSNDEESTNPEEILDDSEIQF